MPQAPEPPAPEFSVVIPVFNAARIIEFFRLCVDSVLDQDFADFELILVDDASTDDTPLILGEYARRDGRVRIHTHKNNQRQGIARNSGTAIARGNYVLYCDYDDYLFPDALSVLHGLARRYRNPDIIQFAHRNLAQAHPSPGSLAPARAISRWARLRGPRLYRLKNALRKFLLGHLVHAPWTRAVRTDIARQVQFTGLGVEDFPHALELFAVADTTLIIPQRLYIHLLRQESEEACYRGKAEFDYLIDAYPHMERTVRAHKLERLFPQACQYFRTWRLLQLAQKLRAFACTPDDVRAWRALHDPRALSARWLLYHLFSGLMRSRLRLRCAQLIDYAILRYSGPEAGVGGRQ